MKIYGESWGLIGFLRFRGKVVQCSIEVYVMFFPTPSLWIEVERFRTQPYHFRWAWKQHVAFVFLCSMLHMWDDSSIQGWDSQRRSWQGVGVSDESSTETSVWVQLEALRP